MKILYTILIFILSTILLSAQRLRPFEPIEFSGLNPDWIVPIKDTVLSSLTPHVILDEYNCLKSIGPNMDYIEFEGFVFHAKYFGGGIQLGGTILECRNLSTGKLEWQKRYGLYADNIQAAIRLMKIDSLGRLVVMGQRKRYALDSPLYEESFLKMVIFEDVIDPKTGEIIETSSCNYEDENLYFTAYDPWGGGVTSGAFFHEGANYRHYEYKRIGEDRYIRSFLMNKCSEVLRDTTQVQVFDILDNVDILEIGNDTIMIMSKKFLASDSTFAFNFKYYTRDLILLDSVLTGSFPNYMLSQQILGLSKDRKKILIKWSRWDNDNPLPPTPESVGVFDLKGYLTKIIHLDANRFSECIVLDWEEDDEITILQPDFRQQNSKSVESYLITTRYDVNENKKEVLNSFKVKDSLKILNFHFVKNMLGNKWLISFTQIELFIKPTGTISQDADGRSVMIMLVDKDRFTKPTSSREVAEEEKGLIIYPNPGSDALTLAWQYSFSGEISVHNAQGHFVRQYPVDHQQEYIIDASAWPPGLYLMRIYDRQKQVTNIKKWVKR
jgi:hypothetical protein